MHFLVGLILFARDAQLLFRRFAGKGEGDVFERRREPAVDPLHGLRERPMQQRLIEAMNAAGTDFAIFGNHEFDITEKELQQRINESTFQWISSNAFHQQAGNLEFSLELLDKKGLNIAEQLQVSRVLKQIPQKISVWGTGLLPFLAVFACSALLSFAFPFF